MFSFINNKINAFGLDLSDRSIKVAQLEKRKDNGLKLYACWREDIPKGLIVGGEIKNEKETSELIKKTLANSKPNPIKSKFVVYSIPEPKAFIRVVKLRNYEENLEKSVKYEVEQSFPIDIENSYIDWQVLSKSSNEVLEVLTAAVPKQIVDSYSSLLRSVGLKPVAAEIESVAIARSLINEKCSSRPILIIDLGKDRTSFIILKKPVVQFTASIPICGKEFIKAISKKLDVSEEEAEKLKGICGLKNDGKCRKIYKAIQPSLNEMAKYIDKLVNYYKEHYKSESNISKIIICGGEAKMFGIDSFLSLKIKKEIERGNPWVNIIHKTREIPPISKSDSLVFVTVLGLALRGIYDF